MTGPVLADVLAVAVAVAVAWYLPDSWYWVEYIFVALVVVATLWLAGRYARWGTTSFVLTTDRVVTRRGALSRRGREIPLDRINDISYSQSFLDRLVGGGSLMLESGGIPGQQIFTNVAHPARVQNLIYAQIEQHRMRRADREAGRMTLSFPEQLEKLDELRQRGILTDTEFNEKKADLLRRF